MTIAGIKALEGTDEDAPITAEASEAPSPAEGVSADSQAAPLIHPAKIINVTRDLPSSVPAKSIYFIKAVHEPQSRPLPQGLHRSDSRDSFQPGTPDRYLDQVGHVLVFSCTVCTQCKCRTACVPVHCSESHIAHWSQDCRLSDAGKVLDIPLPSSILS